MHSVRLELTKLILIGSRTTYKATGDAGLHIYIGKWFIGIALDEMYRALFSV